MRCIPLLLALLSPVATWAEAVEWPGAKSIVYIVPFTPGGTVDTIGRTLAQKLGERLHQTVVVENKPSQAARTGAALRPRRHGRHHRQHIGAKPRRESAPDRGGREQARPGRRHRRRLCRPGRSR